MRAEFPATVTSPDSFRDVGRLESRGSVVEGPRPKAIERNHIEGSHVGRREEDLG